MKQPGALLSATGNPLPHLTKTYHGSRLSGQVPRRVVNFRKIRIGHSMEVHALFSSSGSLFLTLPTAKLARCISISSAGIGSEQVDGRLVGDFSAEPAVVVTGPKDDGHTGVDLGGEFVRLGCDDGEGLQPVVNVLRGSLGFLPCIPETGEGKGLAVSHVEAVGGLAGGFAIGLGSTQSI